MEKWHDLHKELELIQSIISRMANNSFLIKGWTMTLMSALIAFGKDSILANINGIYYLVMMLGILIPFWWLDAYYLRQERLFRKVYNKVIKDPEAKKRLAYSLDIKEEFKSVISIWRIMWTGSVRWFYIPIILLLGTGIVLKTMGLL